MGRVLQLAKRNQIVQQFLEDDALDWRELKCRVDQFPYEHYEADSEARWHAMPTDYPATSDEFTADDQLAYTFASNALKDSNYSDDEERSFLVYCLARLTPYRRAESLLPFLAEDDMFIPKMVSQTLFLRRYEDAIPCIVSLALNGNLNCRQSAEGILAKFVVTGTPAVKLRIHREYAVRGGDTTRLESFINAVRDSPTLIYQW